MAKQYYYLTTGLPDLYYKSEGDLPEFKTTFEDIFSFLDSDDKKLINYPLYEYDNQNIINFLVYKKDNFIQPSVFDKETIQNISHTINEFPEYIKEFYKYIENHPDKSSIEKEKVLTEYFYSELNAQNNKFLTNYFNFLRDLKNIITGINCRKLNLKIEDHIINNNNVADSVIKSNANDFGLSDMYPFISQIIDIMNKNDLIALEEKIDTIKWDYLDEILFLEHFTIDKILGFVEKLKIVYRWKNLESQDGNERLQEIVKSFKDKLNFEEIS